MLLEHPSFWSDHYFNSIKVRLERAAALSAGAGLLFQFHKGAIRTHKKIEEIDDPELISIP